METNETKKGNIIKHNIYINKKKMKKKQNRKYKK